MVLIAEYRVAVGISANGDMVGPAGSTSNAVICSPGADFSVQQYDITGASFAGIVPHPTSGTGNFSCLQKNGVTVMTWSRGVNNGDPNDAQVSTYALTNVIWAIGSSNVFNSTKPNMGNTPVNLMAVPVYKYSVPLTSGLTLNWNVNGNSLQFQAILADTKWCVLPLPGGVPGALVPTHVC